MDYSEGSEVPSLVAVFVWYFRIFFFFFEETLYCSLVLCRDEYLEV